MTNQKVTVVARIRALPEFADSVKQSLIDLVGPTLQEEGCINYDMHEDLMDPCLFVFHENWSSQEDLDRHLASPHLTHWKESTGDWLAEPVEILRLQRVS